MKDIVESVARGAWITAQSGAGRTSKPHFYDSTNDQSVCGSASRPARPVEHDIQDLIADRGDSTSSAPCNFCRAIRAPFDDPREPVDSDLKVGDLPTSLHGVARTLAGDDGRLAFAITRVLRDFGRPPRFEIDERLSMSAESLVYLVACHSGRFEYECARGESNAWPPASDAGALSS